MSTVLATLDLQPRFVGCGQAHGERGEQTLLVCRPTGQIYDLSNSLICGRILFEFCF